MKEIRRFRNIFYNKLYVLSRLLDINILGMHIIFRFNYEKKMKINFLDISLDEIYFLSRLDKEEKKNYHDPPTKYEKTTVEQFQEYLLHDIIDDNETR
jgi:hypothetical protein